jgi:hypothetical protein
MADDESVVDKVKNYFTGKKPEKEDTSWHDSMVKAANESFRKSAEDDAKASVKKVTAGSAAKKISAKKQPTVKRANTKKIEK